jgi:hypothetical protein
LAVHPDQLIAVRHGGLVHERAGGRDGETAEIAGEVEGDIAQRDTITRHCPSTRIEGHGVQRAVGASEDDMSRRKEPAVERTKERPRTPRSEIQESQFIFGGIAAADED